MIPRQKEAILGYVKVHTGRAADANTYCVPLGRGLVEAYAENVDGILHLVVRDFVTDGSAKKRCSTHAKGFFEEPHLVSVSYGRVGESRCVSMTYREGKKA